MLFYGPVLGWDIITTGPASMTLYFLLRGGETEGRESRKRKILVLPWPRKRDIR